jgi:hypothetical protein
MNRLHIVQEFRDWLTRLYFLCGNKNIIKVSNIFCSSVYIPHVFERKSTVKNIRTDRLETVLNSQCKILVPFQMTDIFLSLPRGERSTLGPSQENHIRP